MKTSLQHQQRMRRIGNLHLLRCHLIAANNEQKEELYSRDIFKVNQDVIHDLAFTSNPLVIVSFFVLAVFSKAKHLH